VQVRNRAKRSEKLRLLQDVNALFQPSSMAAIMGPSGSGVPLPLLQENAAKYASDALAC
jgi:ABC-type polar amino acid transport system ATPase subunit